MRASVSFNNNCGGIRKGKEAARDLCSIVFFIKHLPVVVVAFSTTVFALVYNHCHRWYLSQLVK